MGSKIMPYVHNENIFTKKENWNMQIWKQMNLNRKYHAKSGNLKSFIYGY